MSAFFDDALARWRECRADYELDLIHRYTHAEHELGGALVNARGRARDVDPVSLFMGPATRAHAYASDELLEHWEKYPRVTFEQFARRWEAAMQSEWYA